MQVVVFQAGAYPGFGKTQAPVDEPGTQRDELGRDVCVATCRKSVVVSTGEQRRPKIAEAQVEQSVQVGHGRSLELGVLGKGDQHVLQQVASGQAIGERSPAVGSRIQPRVWSDAIGVSTFLGATRTNSSYSPTSKVVPGAIVFSQTRLPVVGAERTVAQGRT